RSHEGQKATRPRRGFGFSRSTGRDQKLTASNSILEAIGRLTGGEMKAVEGGRVKIVVRREDLKQVLEAIKDGDEEEDDAGKGRRGRAIKVRRDCPYLDTVNRLKRAWGSLPSVSDQSLVLNLTPHFTRYLRRRKNTKKNGLKRTLQENEPVPENPILSSKRAREGARRKRRRRRRTRVWSHDDEVTLLKGMIAFRDDMGRDPSADLTAFHDSIKEKLKVVFSWLHTLVMHPPGASTIFSFFSFSSRARLEENLGVS
ncbi:DNA-binding storekeeper protein-related transcriptional regulator, partial [Striga hermonthica]